jgi:OOP family OmpA-OmpF porin
MKTKLLMTLGVASLALNAQAQEYPDFEAYLGAAQYFWDSERDLDDSTAIELGAEVPMNEKLSLEAWLNDFDADVESGTGEADGNRYSLGALYHLKDGDYRPFLTLGASHQEFDFDGAEIDESVLYAGVGAKKYFDNNLVLRGDLMALNSLDHEMTDIAIRLAVGYAFGRSGGASEPVADAALAPSETVQEAVPAKEEVVAPVKEEKSTMPTEQPAKPLVIADADQDGVADADDQCPDTDAAFKVDASGCPVKLMKSVSIDLHVKFKTNSAEVTADSLPEVKEMAEFLNKFTGTTVTVEGHTDDRGAAAYNKSLSQKRADSVRALLVNEYGIEADRVSAKGYGEEQPIATNDTAEGRASNRRVVAVVEAQEETMEMK